MVPAELESFPDVQALEEFDPATVQGGRHERGELTLEIAPPKIAAVCEFLKSGRGYNFLSDLTATDWFPVEPRFHLAYHLYSLGTHQSLRLKVKLAGDDPRVESICAVWPGANWYERELFDLFGIFFTGHPDLRRILMPDDWEGHPLRKDYPMEGPR